MIVCYKLQDDHYQIPLCLNIFFKVLLLQIGFSYPGNWVQFSYLRNWMHFGPTILTILHSKGNWLQSVPTILTIKCTKGIFNSVRTYSLYSEQLQSCDPHLSVRKILGAPYQEVRQFFLVRDGAGSNGLLYIRYRSSSQTNEAEERKKLTEYISLLLYS